MGRLVQFSGSKLIIAVVVIACSMGVASQVNAVTNFTEGDQYYLGSISPDGGSNEEQAAQINHLVTVGSGTFNGDTYVRSGVSCGSPCPVATAVGSVKDDTGGNTGTLDPTGWTYLKAKYDAAQAGAYIWFVAGLTGDFTVPTSVGTCGSGGCDLSHWSLFNPGTNNVAEPSILLFAGLGLVGLVGASRRFMGR